jgi:hypothetical protein
MPLRQVLTDPRYWSSMGDLWLLWALGVLAVLIGRPGTKLAAVLGLAGMVAGSLWVAVVSPTWWQV